MRFEFGGIMNPRLPPAPLAPMGTTVTFSSTVSAEVPESAFMKPRGNISTDSGNCPAALGEDVDKGRRKYRILTAAVLLPLNIVRVVIKRGLDPDVKIEVP